MGNPNFRPRQKSTALTASISPKTISSAFSKMTVEDAPTTKGAKAPKSEEVNPQKTALPFRSMREGTLITGRFGSPPTACRGPQPFPKASLNPKTPDFVPATVRTPSKLHHNAASQQYLSPPMSDGGSEVLQKIKTLIQTFPPAQSSDNYHVGPLTNVVDTPNRQSVVPITPPSPGQSAECVPGQPRYFISRARPQEPDIIITAEGIEHNIARVAERQLPNGLLSHTVTPDFDPKNHDVLNTILKKSEKDRQDFWEINWVEIVVDLRGDQGASSIQDNDKEDMGKAVVRAKASVINMMEKFGPDFAKYTRTVFVTIYFGEESVNAEAIKSCTKAQQKSAGFKLLEDLVVKLDDFEALQKLEIILRTPSRVRSPISIEQLNLALPFYDLKYEDWDIKWQAEYMSRPERVTGWPITYLDRERYRITQERIRKEREQQRKLDNIVYVRESVFVPPLDFHSPGPSPAPQNS